MTKSSNKGQTVGGKYSGIEFLQTPGRTPASGSLLEGTPVLRIPARRNLGSPLRSTPGLVPRTAPFPREKENFRQGESSIFPNMEEFNLLQPTKAHLKKTSISLKLYTKSIPIPALSIVLWYSQRSYTKIPYQFWWVNFLVSKEALRHSHIWGNVVRLSVSAIYDEHQKAKTQKRREGVGQMGTHEGMAREAGGSLGYQRRVPPIFIRVQGNQPAIGGFYSGCHLEVRCGVAILGGAFFLNDSS
ncbi:hypothetical protein HID58_087135, partial [Brassica napus]